MRLRIVLGVVVALLILLAVSALLLFTARSAMSAGLAEMDLAKAELQPSPLNQSPAAALATARRHLASAHDNFASASNRLGPLAPLLEHLSWVPVVGPDLSASHGLAELAAQTTQGMVPLVNGLIPAASLFRHGRGIRASAITDRLAGAHGDFRVACVQLADAQSLRRALHEPFSARVRSALHTLDQQLPRAVNLCHGLLVAPALLGHDRPRHYLVAYEDAAELRAAGGFLGSAGILIVKNGTAHQDFRTVAPANENFTVPAPEPVSYYNHEPYWLFRDSNWSPDFPTTAGLERYFLRLDLGAQVDGVIDLTPDGAQALLQGTGPLFLPEYHRWVNAGNVASLADYYAHWTSNPGPYQIANADVKRKQFIQIVAQHVLTKLQQLSAGQLTSLAQGLGKAIAEKGILVSLSHPAEDRLIRSIGAAGAMSRTTGDYLYFVNNNLSYNKINPWVHVFANYRVRIRPDRWLDGHLRLRITNGPQPARLERQGTGPGAGLYGSNVDYADFIRVFVPAGAQLIDQYGWTQPWSSGPAYGKTMFCGYILVPKGQSRTIELHYITPPNVFSATHGARYHLVVQHQPGSHPEAIRVHVVDVTRNISNWTLTKPTTDHRLSARVQPRSFTPIPLPKAVWPVVAPGHWIEPHAFLAHPGS